MATRGSTAAASFRRCLAEALVRRCTLQAASTSLVRRCLNLESTERAPRRVGWAREQEGSGLSTAPMSRLGGAAVASSEHGWVELVEGKS
jgi:hypothetical protein